MFERFTDRARKVMVLANQESQRFNHEYIGTEHMLLGLIKEGSGVGATVLSGMGVNLETVRNEVLKLVKAGPDPVNMGKLPMTPRGEEVIKYTIEEAKNLNCRYIGTEHVLLGLLREHEGVAAQVLMNLGCKIEEMREAVITLLGRGAPGRMELGINVEPVFELRAQDALAPAAVESWANLAELVGVDEEKVREARAIAARMKAWHHRKIPD